MTISKKFRNWIHNYLLSCTNVRRSSLLDRSDHSFAHLTSPNSSFGSPIKNRNDSNGELQQYEEPPERIQIVTSKGHCFDGDLVQLRLFIQDTFKDLELFLTDNRG